VNADVNDIKVIFVDEPEDIINPLGIKGLGEIGIVGVAAAIAIYLATSADAISRSLLTNCSDYARPTNCFDRNGFGGSAIIR